MAECTFKPQSAATVYVECRLIDGVPVLVAVGYDSFGKPLWVRYDDPATGDLVFGPFEGLPGEPCPPGEAGAPPPGSDCDNPVFTKSCDDTFHSVKTGYLCVDGTWQCKLLTWINGEAQPDTMIDSGIACDQPIPSQDPEIKWVEKCVDNELVLQLCYVVFTNDGEGNITPGAAVEIGDPIETGKECNVKSYLLGSKDYCVTAIPPSAGVFADSATFLGGLDVATQGTESFASLADGSYAGAQTTPSGTWEHRDYNAGGLFVGTSRTIKVETPVAQNGASLAVKGLETVGGGTTSPNSIIHCLASPVGMWGADVLDLESDPAFLEAQVIAYDAALNPIVTSGPLPDGSDIVQFVGVVSEANDIAYVQVIVGDANGGTLSDQLALTNVVFGTLNSSDVEEYCEVTTLENGVKVTTVYGPDGDAVPALPEGAELCGASVIPVDYEYIRVPVCADDTNLLAQSEYLDGVLTPGLVFFDMLGDEIAAPAAYVLGFCAETEFDVTSQPICIDGTPAVIKTYVNPATQEVIAQQFCDNDGLLIAAPAVWEYGSCKCGTPETWKRKEYYFGLENTKTRFNRSYEVEIKLNNGDIRTVALPAASGWGPQMTAWAAALAAAFPELCEVTNHWWEWRPAFLPNTGLGAIPPSDMQFPAARGQFIQFTACPDQLPYLPVDAKFTMLNGNPWERPALYAVDESVEEYFTHCISCDPGCEDDAPKCAIPAAGTFPMLPTPLCTFKTENACDNGTDPDTDIVIVYSICDGVISAEYFIDDGSGNLEEYTLVGIPVNCLSGEPVVEPEPEFCGVPTGKVLCYGTEGGAGSEYTNADNNTDISYSNNQTTIKWEVDTGIADGSGAYTLAIAACIASGETAYLTITDSAGVTTNFAADTVAQQGAANGGGFWVFTGVGGPSFSGKIITSSFTCGTPGENGKAMQLYDCLLNAYKWIDCLDASITISVDDLNDCPVEVEPVLDSIEVIQCATEAGANVAVGDYILFIGQTTDGVLTSSTAYNLSQGNIVLDPAPSTEPCDPTPEITELKNCLVDTNGALWTQVLVYLADSNPANPPVLDFVLYYDAVGALGTPAGDPKEWKPCANLSGLVDIEKVCFEFFGQEVKGYAFAYSDGEVQLGTTIDPASAVSVSNAAVYCCEDCIQVFGCRDGRLAWPLGSEAVMANGDVIDISGLRYSQAAALIVATYGGTYKAPSLGGPQGPNFSQCQGSSQHELQFFNLPVQITSIDDMTNYGTFGNCMPQRHLDKLCEIARLLTCEDDFTACTRVDAFHSADMLDIGDTTTYEIKLGGVVQTTIVHDHTTTYTAPNRSTMYTPVIAAINALPNWNWSLISETGWNVSQKQEWQVDYSGPGDEELSVCSNGGGQLNVLRLYVDASGVLHTQAYDTPPASNTDTGIDFNTAAFRDCP